MNNAAGSISAMDFILRARPAELGLLGAHPSPSSGTRGAAPTLRLSSSSRAPTVCGSCGWCWRGLMMALTLTALDQNIIATAVSRIDAGEQVAGR